MNKENLCASLYFFDGQEPATVRAALAGALNCVFDEEFAKSDEFGTTWFGDVFGFEISFGLVSRREDGAWYLVTLSPSILLFEPEAPQHYVNFHLSLLLGKAGFTTIATTEEYNSQHHRPPPPPKT